MQKKPDKSQIENLKFLHVQQDFLALEQESRLILENYPNNSDVQNFLGAALAGQVIYDDTLVVLIKAVVDAELAFAPNVKVILAEVEPVLANNLKDKV